MRYPLALALLLIATPALAQERDYCPQRPGLGDEPCTIEPGRVSLEVGMAAWERDSGPDVQSDTILLGDTVARIGIAHSADLGLAWTAYTHARTRDRVSGLADTQQGVGDLTVTLKRNLLHPDGTGFSIALAPFVSLPIASGGVGAGDWSAGLEVPLNFDLGHGLALESTSLIAAMADGDRKGRHCVVSEIVGLGIDLTDAVNLTGEVEALRDDDPDGHTTQAFAALALAWSASKNLQLDLGAVAGLNAQSPDVRIYAGFARRF